MFKKVFSALTALAFTFNLTTQISKITAHISSACSYVYCDHDGDGWSW